jgi:hypothetical protein
MPGLNKAFLKQHGTKLHYLDTILNARKPQIDRGCYNMARVKS